MFSGTPIEPRVMSEQIGAASAVKMAYGAWTKGTAALILAIRAVARAEGVEPVLLEEWRNSQPQLGDLSTWSAYSAATKGWRWLAEMDEIAATFAAAGLPDGFHRAASEIYRRSPRIDDAAPDDALLQRVVDGLARPDSS